MKPDLKFEFVADRANHTLTISREFAAGRQLVWDCHTRSELLDRWFAPKPLTTRTRHMDFRDGGYWHYAMVMPDGEAFWSRLDYLKIDPIDGYTALDGFCDETGTVNPEMPRSNWKVTFTDASDRTLVTTVVLFSSAEDLQKTIDMGMEAGMASTLERLDELLPLLSTSSE
ncbi:SRPBCC domain-containing protein [Novosphingobium sp. BL-8A]|uniref:SRPBCC family protein n=1 Tax=Novosphingobium sp. BL-8A TaxID=3127639 RepID=UPI003757D51E